ncbi:sigma-54-dependent transcriptional regulator [Desulfurivibrio dismutans]|uniref:sigma-54-dependent transcriptional regulator n=1 Tax=Desulfurivibrio dismutans TaxID=1398908 RepID=UPI0023DB565C|nr:sigma 54-interacting transcriptional regulator [Desulfurivibrio alkaliphilus]MDF1613838.1 sigma 54-interacting transcriptional regulator [Desulfurivibrio alkaliphilus]
MAEKKWIDTPGLKDILEKDVPLAGELLASNRYPILVRGMLRTGKSHIRDKIWEASGLEKIKEGVINCAAIPENLAEAILFGYKKGAFTGASNNKPGLLFDESIPPKVVFLEEIGELPQYVQAKLLVFFDTGAFMPVGAEWGQGVKSTLVVIATSNAEDDKFRPDFLARFWEVKVPPLHERREDIPFFLNLFLEGKEQQLTTEELFHLMAYNWPKGVTEIEKTCIKIKHYIFTMKLARSERYDFVKKLLTSLPPAYDNYMQYCHYLVWHADDYTIEKLFPYFCIDWPSPNKQPMVYDIHKLIREWKAWCFFFDQNPKSPTNIYEDIQKKKPGKGGYYADIFHHWGDSKRTLDQSYDNDHRLAYFVDFLKEQKMWNEDGLTFLNNFRRNAFEELFEAPEEENSAEAVQGQPPPFETMRPSDYLDQFWDYQVERGRTGAEIEKKYGINRKTAETNMRNVKKRSTARED